METLQDLIEEAKLRTVWWAVCIFIVTYFLTHTSKSMWMNVPIAILLVSGIHILLSEVEFHWKIRKPNKHSYLKHLENKQMSINDSRLTTLPPPKKWQRKIESPVVEAAMEDFVNKILQEFVLDLWYSSITPDKEAPELIHAIIMDIFAEISTRVKDINLVDLLTRDVVDLVGDHLELFRKNQAEIGREVMVTLSSEERDDRLKHHLTASKDLHPACISSESEYKYLKRVVGAVLAAVLRPREAQCPLVRCITRELLTCLVLEPVMKFASPGRINEIIVGIFLANKEENDDQPVTTNGEKSQDSSQKSEKILSTPNEQNENILNLNPAGTGPGLIPDESLQPLSSGWARVLEVATQRRTEVLQPENLENMWTRGRNYKKKAQKKGINEYNYDQQNADSDQSQTTLDPCELVDEFERSNSAFESNIQSQSETSIQVGGTIISEFYSPNAGNDNEFNKANSFSDKVTRSEGYIPKLKCRVLGAYYENIDSKSFAVYSVAVTDVDNKTWFVKRRYRNFEKLHRHLKDIPNYTLHLPPKRIFSSSTEDAFVHQRCIQLDKYLKDLLSIPNVAEQHEVWDFLSMSSKSYSYGRSSSVVKALAVNVDEAVDDIVRQFRGASDLANSFSENRENESNSKENERNLEIESTVERSFEIELNLKDNKTVDLEGKNRSELLSLAANSPSTSGGKEDPLGMPAEWTPPNVSVPLLNLVDTIFQLNRRGWLRRQVFWMSKQILQLMMEDAIDDWLVRQIHWLRRDNVVAQGIRWIQDILWPEGTFFLKVKPSQPESCQSNQGSSSANNKNNNNNNNNIKFEEQLEAARRASDIKKMIFKGAPSTLVSLIGSKQYKRCAKDIYYFLQSAVCLKQLGYGLLELALITIFPELQDVISNVHDKKEEQPV